MKPAIIPFTAAAYICILCGGAIRTDLDAPKETAWYMSLANGRKRFHIVCADKRQLVLVTA